MESEKSPREISEACELRNLVKDNVEVVEAPSSTVNAAGSSPVIEGMKPLPAPLQLSDNQSLSLTIRSSSSPETIRGIPGTVLSLSLFNHIPFKKSIVKEESSPRSSKGKERARESSYFASSEADSEDVYEDVTSAEDSRSSPSPRHRHSTRRRRMEQAPWVDANGLEHPPPAGILYGDRRLIDADSGRRYYPPRIRRMLPWQHDPIMRIHGENQSASAFQALGEVEIQMNRVLDTNRLSDKEKEDEIERLNHVAQFVEMSASLSDWDEWSHDRTLEARMEDLLKEFGYDKMKPVKRPMVKRRKMSRGNALEGGRNDLEIQEQVVQSIEAPGRDGVVIPGPEGDEVITFID